MKLITKELEKKLPPLYSTQNDPDPIVLIHYFNPMGTGDWYVTEGAIEVYDVDGKEVPSWTFYALCDLGYPEWGYVTLMEMESVKLPFGLGIERDLHWTPRPVSQIKKVGV